MCNAKCEGVKYLKLQGQTRARAHDQRVKGVPTYPIAVGLIVISRRAGDVPIGTVWQETTLPSSQSHNVQHLNHPAIPPPLGLK